MDDAALTAACDHQHPYATCLRIPQCETQNNYGYTLNPVENVDPLASHVQTDGETADWRGDFEFIQATEINATLASMNLNEGSDPTQSFTHSQSATARTSQDPPYIRSQNSNPSDARNACTVLRIELNMALDAYRQSRDTMQWHAANVCRVNVQYLRALQAAHRLDG